MEQPATRWKINLSRDEARHSPTGTDSIFNALALQTGQIEVDSRDGSSIDEQQEAASVFKLYEESVAVGDKWQKNFDDEIQEPRALTVRLRNHSMLSFEKEQLRE